MKLFHYQRILKKIKNKPEEIDNEYLDAIKNNTIYLSTANEFNDPYECNFTLDITNLHPARYKQFIPEYYEDIDLKNRYLTEKEYLKEHQNSISDKFIETIRHIFGIYCLSPKPSSIPMWAYYADNHAGIALEYTLNHKLIEITNKVTYQDKYPVISLEKLLLDGERNDAGDNVLYGNNVVHSELYKLFYTKHKSWRHESEFRYVSNSRGLIENPFVLSGVIFGCNFPSKLIYQVKDELKHMNLSFKYAIINKRKFKIELKDELT